jgi:hypothetical protein
MFLQTYIKVTLLLTGLHTLERRSRTKRPEDSGLATLEWVALIIVALALATAAGVAITAVLNNKLAQIQ